MELVEMRPVWSQSDSELLTTLDALNADISRQQTYRLQVIARLDETGHAKELGARDTVELLSLRHRVDPADVRRDLKLAQALPKYDAVRAALPDPLAPTDLAADHDSTTPDSTDTDAEPAASAPVRLHPAQAQAIVTALEKVPQPFP
jgi:hypothetical protein